MDNSFNSSSQIEILNTSPSAIKDERNMSMGKCNVKTNFEMLTWGTFKPTESIPLGLIAGGMDDGSITIWNPYNLMSSSASMRHKALIGTHSDKHKQKITAMAFDNKSYLATADVGESLWMWNLTKPTTPIA